MSYKKRETLKARGTCLSSIILRASCLIRSCDINSEHLFRMGCIRRWRNWVLFLYEMAFKNFIISIAFSQYIQSRNWTKFTYIFSHYAAFDTQKNRKNKKVKCSFFLNISNMTLFEICCCHTFLFLNVDEDYYKQDHSNYKWVILHMCFNIKCLKNYSIIFNFNKKGVSCSFKWWPVDLQVICSTLEHWSDLSTYP